MPATFWAPAQIGPDFWVWNPVVEVHRLLVKGGIFVAFNEFLEHFVLVVLPVLLVRFVLNPDVLLAGNTFHVDLFVFFIFPGFRCLDAPLSRFTSFFCWLYHPNESRRYRYKYSTY